MKLFILIFLVQISLLHSQQPNPPTLNSPANLEIFNRNSTSSITWSWSRVTGALEYQLKNYWVGSDYTAISVNGSTTSYTDNNVSTWQIPHEFEWKVRVRTSGGWSNWSTPRRYYLDVTPSAPSLSSPPDNSTYYFGQNATFSYNPPSGVTNVSEYMIKFTQTGSADKPITSGSNNYKSITFPDVLGLGDWNWSVKIMKSYPSGYDYTKYATKIGWSPFPASRKLTLKYPSPNLFMNQSLRITTTRTDVSTIYSIPSTAEYSYTAPIESEMNLSANFTIRNNGVYPAQLDDWGVYISGGQNTNFYVSMGSITLQSGQTCTFYNNGNIKKIYLQDDKLNNNSTTNYTAEVRYNYNGQWYSNISGSGRTANFTVTQRPAFYNGQIIKRPRNQSSFDNNVYFYFNNKKWDGNSADYDYLFTNPDWKTTFYIYPKIPVDNISNPTSPKYDPTVPKIAGRNLLYKLSNSPTVYIIEPESNTSNPLKSRAFIDEFAFYSYYCKTSIDQAISVLKNECIPFSQSQVNYLQTQFPVGTSIYSLITPSQNQNWTSPEITFSWVNIGANHYEVLVDCDINFTTIKLDKTTHDTDKTPTSYTANSHQFQPDTSYYWKVIAYKADGSKIAESSVGKFTYSPPFSSEPNWVPLFRLYNDSAVVHYYCTDSTQLAAAFKFKYRYERTEGFLSNTPFKPGAGNDLVCIYWLYMKAKPGLPKTECHFFVATSADRDKFIKQGFIYEGITGYTYKLPKFGMAKLYHTYIDNGTIKDDFYTCSASESDNSSRYLGYSHTTNDNGLLCYVSRFGATLPMTWMEGQAEVGQGINTGNGNLSHITKTSFSIPEGRISLDFTHVYNSMTTRYGTEINPLGNGWSHTYSTCLYIDDFDNSVYAFWPGGNVHSYNSVNTTAIQSITPGVYDFITKTSSTTYQIKKPDQTIYYFVLLNSSNYVDKIAYLDKIIDRNGNTIKCNYINNLLTSVQTQNNRYLTFKYKGTPTGFLITQVKDSTANRIINFEYDDSLNLIKFTDAEGLVTQYDYEKVLFPYDHLLIQITLPKGNIIKNQYANSFSDKRIISQTITQANQTTKSVTTDYISNPYVSVKDERGYEWRHYYPNTSNPDKANLINKLVTPSGQNVLFQYNDATNSTKPTWIQDSKGNVTNVTYNSMGNATNIQKPLGITHQFSYNSFNDVTQYTNPRNYKTNYNYDSKGNLNQIITPRDGSLTATTYLNYNSNGTINNTRDPLNRTTNFTYNTYGNVQTITDILGNLTRYDYDNISRVTKITNPKNQQTTYNYNKNDWLLSTTNADNKTTYYYYDKNGNDTAIQNSRGYFEKMDYDFSKDWIINKINPLGYKTHIDYFDDGSVKTITKPDNGYTPINYTYYDNGNLKTVSHTNNISTLIYDPNDNLNSVSDNNGTITFNNYDALNRLTSYTDFYGQTVSYQYDSNSNITQIAYPGNKTANYTYYDDDLLKSVSDWLGNTTTYYYFPDGSIDHINNANGTKTEYFYDLAGKLKGILNRKSNGDTISCYSYQLDSLGNQKIVTQKEPLPLMPVNSSTTTYSYDANNRLTGDGTNTYSYDNNGNMTRKGNNNYTYDALNQLKSISGNINNSYIYDYFGNRRAATRNGVTTKYVLDIKSSMSRILIETDGNNNPINYYIYGLGLISRINQSNNNIEYYHYDSRGSTIAITDANQNITHKYSYTDFGEVSLKVELNNDSNPFKFVGSFGVMDEGNGLHFMRARYYDEANGRFLQEDPVYNQNLYLYAENNPMMGIDPNGLYANSTQPIINDDNSSYPWWYNATNWGWDDDPKTLKTIETVGLGLSLGLAVAPAIAALPVVGASAATLSTLGGGAAIATGINEIPTVAKMFSGELTSKDAIIESVTLAGSALGDIKTKNIKGTKGIVTAIGKSIGKAIDLADKLKSGLKIITNTASIVKRKK